MKPTVPQTFRFWLPVLLLCLAIFVQSSFPSIDTDLDFKLEDKLQHLLAYGVLAILTARALRRSWPGRFSLVQLFLLSAGFAALYGLSDEFHQYWVPSRQADTMDFVADAIGAVLGAFVYLWHNRIR